MQRRGHVRALALEAIEFVHGIPRLRHPHFHCRRPQRREGLLRHSHAPELARTDREHLRRVGETGLQIRPRQPMPFLPSPALLHVVGEDAQVGIVVVIADGCGSLERPRRI